MAKKALHRKSTLTRLPLTQARARFGEVIKRVQGDKERFVLERDGVPVAALIDIDEFEDYLELQDPKARGIIKQSQEDYVAGRSRPAEELVVELRAADGRKRAPKSQAKARRKAG